MAKKFVTAFVFIAISSSTPASAGDFSGLLAYNSYGDCILDNMTGVGSDLAAREVVRACREKFPLPPESEVKVEPVECYESNIQILETKWTKPDPNKPSWFISGNIEYFQVQFKNLSNDPIESIIFSHGTGEGTDCDGIEMTSYGPRMLKILPMHKTTYSIPLDVPSDGENFCYKLEAVSCKK